MESRTIQNASSFHAVTPSSTFCPQCGASVKFRVDPANDRKSCPHCGYVLPHQIAHFKLSELIGIGGMGAVYRGIDTSLERDVAVKVMREEFAEDPKFVERFLREARATASLSHPNVAQIYSFGEQNSRYYLVMELLPNGSLDDRIRKEHRLPELDVLDIGIQVASGLRAAYERGLIHRDIKPGNILFAQDGTSKIVDFGLARFEMKSIAPLQEEGIWGTPYYIAPEKVSTQKEDFRSDIYSLGGTLFHALAGRPPFEAGTSTEVVLKHLHSPAVSLQAFAPDSTPQTAEVIGRMLKRDPAERPQSYSEVLNDLAYAKRFAMGKRPTVYLPVENKFPIGTLLSTLAIIAICLVVGVWLWIHRAKFFPFLEPESYPPSSPLTPVAIQTHPSQTKEPPPPPPSPSLSDYTTQIEDILNDAGGSNLAGALHQLVQIQKTLPPNHPLQLWLILHTAQIQWLLGYDADAMHRLQPLAKSISPTTLAPPIPELRYPQLLASILLGKISDRTLDKILPSLPEWMRAIVYFDAGLAALHQDQFSEAKRLWQIYIQIKHVPIHSWVLTYQTVAQDFIAEYNQFQDLMNEITDLQAAGKTLKVQQVLQENQGKYQNSNIQASIVKLIETNQHTLLQSQNKEEQERQMTQLAGSEKKLVEDMRVRGVPLMKNYQFDALLQAWKALAPNIKTQDNRKVLDFQIAMAQCFVDFKQQITKDVLAYPYDQEHMITRTNQQMSGKLYQIKDDKLFFRIEFGPDQYGETSCRWSDLLPSAVLELGDFYLMRAMKLPEPNNSELARRAIALAIFAREFGLSEGQTRKYLSLATQTEADIQDSLRQLFPPTIPK